MPVNIFLSPLLQFKGKFNVDKAYRPFLDVPDPLAFLLAKHFSMGPRGVFIAIPVAETAISLAAFILFREGSWKRVKV